eukprot:403355668
MVRKYIQINDEQRRQFLRLVHQEGFSISKASKLASIPYDNAKVINRIYLREQRVNKINFRHRHRSPKYYEQVDDRYFQYINLVNSTVPNPQYFSQQQLHCNEINDNCLQGCPPEFNLHEDDLCHCDEKEDQVQKNESQNVATVIQGILNEKQYIQHQQLNHSYNKQSDSNIQLFEPRQFHQIRNPLNMNVCNMGEEYFSKQRIFQKYPLLMGSPTLEVEKYTDMTRVTEYLCQRGNRKSVVGDISQSLNMDVIFKDQDKNHEEITGQIFSTGLMSFDFQPYKDQIQQYSQNQQTKGRICGVRLFKQ